MQPPAGKWLNPYDCSHQDTPERNLGVPGRVVVPHLGVVKAVSCEEGLNVSFQEIGETKLKTGLGRFLPLRFSGDHQQNEGDR